MLGSSTRFLDPDGYPAITPPWGSLTAIDMNKGTFAWRIPFGEYPELAAKGMKNTGSENYGGGVLTAGGALLYRSNQLRQKIPCLRQAYWRAPLGDDLALRWKCNTFRL
jgi:quinoprotein glucose dehydrogenase